MFFFSSSFSLLILNEFISNIYFLNATCVKDYVFIVFCFPWLKLSKFIEFNFEFNEVAHTHIYISINYHKMKSADKTFFVHFFFIIVYV